MAECADPDCKATFRDHRWGAIHAHAAGWLQQKDGTVWCPNHLPGWVADWRARRART